MNGGESQFSFLLRGGNSILIISTQAINDENIVCPPRFESLSPANEGLYRCKAETRGGIFYEDFNLTVAAGSGFRTS
jgi:hypothetical protein